MGNGPRRPALATGRQTGGPSMQGNSSSSRQARWPSSGEEMTQARAKANQEQAETGQERQATKTSSEDMTASGRSRES
ncbi:unnamed protein product [Lampetra planeri]